MSLILNHPLISQRYFFPRHVSLSDPTWIESNEERLACWFYKIHPSPHPTLVHFHGNGEVVADWIDFFQSLAKQLGINLLLVEYRGYGESTGRPQLVSQLDDLKACFDFLKMTQEY